MPNPREKGASPDPMRTIEDNATELAAWLKSLGVTREQVERAFRAGVNPSRGHPRFPGRGQSTGR